MGVFICIAKSSLGRFLAMDRKETVLPPFEDLSLLEFFDQHIETCEFNYSDPFEFWDDTTLPFPDNIDDVHVLQGFRFRQDGGIAKDDPVPFGTFAPLYMGKTSAPASKKKKASTPGFVDELRAKHPWLTDDDIKAAFGKRPKKRVDKKAKLDRQVHSGDEATDGEEEDTENDDGDDEGPDSDGGGTEDELEAVRHEWQPVALPWEAFRIQIRGGHWTKKEKAKPSDCVRGVARGQMVKDWCTGFGYPKEKKLFLLRV